MGIFRKKVKAKQWWKIINFIVFAIMVGVILYMTVYSRTEGTGCLILIPFRSFFEAKNQLELYRSMLMNVFLFVPIGLSLPFVLYVSTMHDVQESKISRRLYSGRIKEFSVDKDDE